MLESQARAIKKYQQQNTTVYTFRLNKKTDLDLIEQLEKQDNKQGYIKNLIRQDILNANGKQ